MLPQETSKIILWHHFKKSLPKFQWSFKCSLWLCVHFLCGFLYCMLRVTNKKEKSARNKRREQKRKGRKKAKTLHTSQSLIQQEGYLISQIEGWLIWLGLGFGQEGLQCLGWQRVDSGRMNCRRACEAPVEPRERHMEWSDRSLEGPGEADGHYHNTS